MKHARKIVDLSGALGLFLVTAAALLAPSPAFSGASFPGAANQEKTAQDVTMPHLTGGSSGNPQVVPPEAHPAGKSYGEWAAAYIQWMASMPISESFLDNGQSFSLHQSGPVWFVQPGCVDRTYTLPVGKFLWAPIFFGWNEYPCPDPLFQPAPGQSMEDFLLEGLATFFPTPPADGSLLVDGQALNNLAAYQATSTLFTTTFDLSLLALDGCVTGGPQPCVAGGYYVMLKPFSPGHHTLEYPGCDVIHVNVVPNGRGRGQTAGSGGEPAIESATWGLLKTLYR